MTRTIHTRIQYQAGNYVKSSHEIHVYTHDSKTILIVVESGAGQSITNSMEWIVSVVRNRYQIIPEIIIEHYPNIERSEVVGTFDHVILIWNDSKNYYGDIRWKPSTREEVEALIGEAFADEEAPAEPSLWITRDMPQCRHCASNQRLYWNNEQYCARCGNPSKA